MKTFLFPLFFAAAFFLPSDLFALADLAPARALIAKKDYAAASSTLEKIVAAEPAHAEAWLELGHTLLSRVNQAGLFSKAGLAMRGAAAFQKAAELDPTSVPAQVSLICYYSNAPFFVGGSRAKARRTARDLVSLDAFAGNFWLMQLALQDDRPDEALVACDAIRKLEPDTYRALCAQGQVCAATGQKLESGAAALRRTLSLTPGKNEPGRASAYEWLGQILEKEGDTTGAVGAYEEALKLSPHQKIAGERLARLR